MSFELSSAMFYAPMLRKEFWSAAKITSANLLLTVGRADGEMNRVFLQNCSRAKCVRFLRTFPAMVSFTAGLLSVKFWHFDTLSSVGIGNGLWVDRRGFVDQLNRERTFQFRIVHQHGCLWDAEEHLFYINTKSREIVLMNANWLDADTSQNDTVSFYPISCPEAGIRLFLDLWDNAYGWWGGGGCIWRGRVHPYQNDGDARHKCEITLIRQKIIANFHQHFLMWVH